MPVIKGLEKPVDIFNIVNILFVLFTFLTKLSLLFLERHVGKCKIQVRSLQTM